jgi:hypothetical protein
MGHRDKGRREERRVMSERKLGGVDAEFKSFSLIANR